LAITATLALGVGANTALFSLLNAIAVRPLALPNPQRLVGISRIDQRSQLRWTPLTVLNELTGRQRTLTDVCGYIGGTMITTDIEGVLVPALAEYVTGPYYDILGISPLKGRLISPADAPPGEEPASVVVLGYRFWQRQFGGDPAVIERHIRIGGVVLTVIGITPADFSGLQVDIVPDVTLPAGLLDRIAGNASNPKHPIQVNYVIGRLRDRVTFEQAQAELNVLWPVAQTSAMPPGLTPREQEEFLSTKPQVQSVGTGFSVLRTRYGTTLPVLVALSALLLALTCMNVGALLLARAVGREQELAVRLALGASRARLAQQIVVETLLFSLMGSVIAWPVAGWASQILGMMLWTGGGMPVTLQLTPDTRVMWVTTAIAISAALLSGAVPAWSVVRGRRWIHMQQACIVAMTGRRGKLLVTTQVALSFSLLFVAGLLSRTLTNLRSTDAGFKSQSVFLARLMSQPNRSATPETAAYYQELVRRLAELPAVHSISTSLLFPFTFDETGFLETVEASETVQQAKPVRAAMEVVSPRFFETVGIRQLEGRDFIWHDDKDQPAVAVINETVARALFPLGSAVGHRIRLGADPSRRALKIVGVVHDTSIGNLRAVHVPLVFRPVLQEPRLMRFIEIRSTADASTLAESVRRVVASLGHHYVLNSRMLEDQIDTSLQRERLTAALATFFAGVAMLLAFIGLYSLLAYAVGRRTREIGVRIALGAPRSVVLRMIASEGVVLTVLGIACGLPCAFIAGHLVRTMLFGLEALDPMTLVGAATLLVVVGSGAGLLPARRASSVQPTVALRCD
jgi:predicted permease